jgi:DUF305 family protein family protein
MDLPLRDSFRRLLFALAFGLACSLLAQDGSPPTSTPRPPSSVPSAGLAAEGSYLAENDAAMTRMMKDMAVKPTGDVDRDFVAMMVPHHQGAIDMAVAVLRHGHNEQVRRLAQEIIVTQQEEIAAMRLAVGAPLPASISSPTQPSAEPSQKPATSPNTKER